MSTSDAAVAPALPPPPPPPLTHESALDASASILLVPCGEPTAGYAVPRDPALLAATSPFLASLCAEEEDTTAVPCAAPLQVLRIVAWYVSYYSETEQRTPFAPWLLPRPLAIEEETEKVLQDSLSLFEQAVLRCMRQSGAATACSVLHTAALLQAPGLGLLAGLALHLDAPSVGATLTALLGPQGGDGSPTDQDLATPPLPDATTELPSGPRCSHNGLSFDTPRCAVLELPELVAVDIAEGPQHRALRRSVAAAVGEYDRLATNDDAENTDGDGSAEDEDDVVDLPSLPLSVRAFYLAFVPGMVLDATVPASLSGAARTGVVLATTAVLRRCTPGALRRVTWARDCDGDVAVNAVASCRKDLVASHGGDPRLRSEHWVWGPHSSATSKAPVLYPLPGWTVAVWGLTQLSQAQAAPLVRTARLDLTHCPLRTLPPLCFTSETLKGEEEEEEQAGDIILPSSLLFLCPTTFASCRSSVDMSSAKVDIIPIACFEFFRGPSLRLPRSVDTVECRAFRGCSASVDLSQCGNLTQVPSSCFRCFVGSSVALPRSIKCISSAAFYQCTAAVDLRGCVKLSDLHSDCFEEFRGPTLRLPAAVSSMRSGIFRGCTAAVDLSDALGLQEISTECFEEFRGPSVRLPCTITILKAAAFCNFTTASLDLSHCVELAVVSTDCFHSFAGSDLRLPPSLSKLRDGAFAECTADVDLSHCGSVVALPDRCFDGFAASQLKLPPALQTLGTEAFARCRTAVVDLSGAPSVTVIPDKCFMAAACVQIVLPPSITTVGDKAFAECQAAVDLSGCLGLTKLEPMAFASFAGATLRLPPTVISLGKACFAHCSTAVDLSACRALTALPARCFADCAADAALALPCELAAIGTEAFAACHCPVDLSATRVTALPPRSFSDFDGASLRLPPGITDVGIGALQRLSSATEVTGFDVNGGVEVRVMWIDCFQLPKHSSE